MRRATGALLLLAACAAREEVLPLTVESDGAWVATFAADREAAYHAAMRVLLADGYSVVRADPMGGSFVAKSEVERTVLGLHYRLARVVAEPAVRGGTRVRLAILRTREPAGGGRRPNNDQPVRDRAEYERILVAVGEELGA